VPRTYGIELFEILVARLPKTPRRLSLLFRSVWTRFIPCRPAFKAVGVAALALSLTTPLPAGAQSNGRIEALNQKIDRLQGELNDLQRSVYQGKVETPVPKVEAAPSADASGQGSAGLSRAAGQRLRERIETLEDDLRRVTGQLEETRHTLRQATKRLDKLVTDVDFRLREMEEFRRQTEARLKALDGGAGQEATASAAQQDGTTDAGADSAGDGRATAGEGGDSGNGGDDGAAVAGREEKTLGQVSPEAVEAMRQKAAEAGQAASDATQDESTQDTAQSSPQDTAQTGGDAGTGAAGNGGQGDTEASGDGTRTAATDAAGDDSADGVRDEYTAAFGLLRQRDYAAAEEALRAFVDAHPEHALAGNAKYWLGETFYVRENYEQAAVVFAEGFRTYPESRKAPDNLLKLGMSLGRIDQVDKACQIFSELQKRFPDAAQNILQRASRERDRLQCGG
jgi:tol-pal system protein YbgF